MSADPIRVLVLEDDEADALLFEGALEQGGLPFEFTRVDTQESFRNAVRSRTWDLIVTDYVLVGHSAAEALAWLAEEHFDVPVVVVSGKVDESAAVEVMRLGARDFVPKEHLARLAPAVSREL